MQVEIVVARYNEDLEWIKNEPFNKYKYTVYNKGPNENYVKTEKFKKKATKFLFQYTCEFW